METDCKHSRMFGTFAAEREDMDIVYGLVDQPQFWNPVKHQVGCFLFVNIVCESLLFSDILLWQSHRESKVNE